MARTHLVFNDLHATPGEPLDQCDWISRLITDIRPDVVINNGDGADMESLCSYDKGTRDFQGRSYGADIASAIEADDRIWNKVKARKKKLPLRIRTIGNHEQRINRALNLSPELEGAIGMNDLKLEDYYDIVVPYEGSTPGVIEVDGVYYAHYLPSGVMGRPIGGEHAAYSLIVKQNASCTVGHSHLWDACRRIGIDGRVRRGLVNGWSGLHRPRFAGITSNLWWAGVTVCHNVENGEYDPEFISLERLRREYGN